MKLFELRAEYVETYDCPEEGKVESCDKYDVIAITINDDTKLKEIADDLSRGFKNYWSLKRSKELHALYPNYDGYRETKYVIHDITDSILVNFD